MNARADSGALAHASEPTDEPGRRFADRRAAGRALATQLQEYARRDDVLVLGVPRGGVPVAAEVAAALQAPLDVWIVRKLGIPGNEECALGALASDGIVDLDRALVQRLRVDEHALQSAIRCERAELERRTRAYRRGRPALRIAGRRVILVDDGLATGSTLRAAVRALRCRLPATIVVAVPVASRDGCATLDRRADRCVCVLSPETFHAVGEWYDDFAPTSDEEVLACLQRRPPRPARPRWPDAPSA